MQQHLMQMQPLMAAYYPNNVTTDHIQQVLPSSPFLHLFPSLLFSSYSYSSHIYHTTHVYVSMYVYVMCMHSFIIHVPSPSAQGPFVSALLVGLLLYATFRTVSLCRCFLVFLFTPFSYSAASSLSASATAYAISFIFHTLYKYSVYMCCIRAFMTPAFFLTA